MQRAKPRKLSTDCTVRGCKRVGRVPLEGDWYCNEHDPGKVGAPADAAPPTSLPPPTPKGYRFSSATKADKRAEWLVRGLANGWLVVVEHDDGSFDLELTKQPVLAWPLIVSAVAALATVSLLSSKSVKP
jgi:hypothetical protein